MLDNETKRRIDTARDILVGKVPDPKSQVEQITIALVYKFMDDMDKEAVELGGKPSFFTGDYERYAWNKIFDPRIGGHEMLLLYGEAIVKLNQNPNLPQLFRDIFKNAYLPYRDPETLKLFLKTINEFSYDHSERLGDAFEYLLSVLGSQGDAGQFRTPRHIIDFMVQLANPQKHETVLDPACGTAGFLISSYKHILKENCKKTPGDLLNTEERKKLLTNFKGYDISPDMVRLSLVNMYLHGFVQPQIMEYDTLTSEERWNEYADVILANPPFMSPKGGIKPHKKFSVQSNRSEVLFVDYIAEHLTPTGRAAIIVPEGIIFQSATAYKALRKMLVENHLYAVVSLPAGIFNPYSGVKTSILLMDRQLAKKTDSILFVKIENDGFGLGAQRREQTGSDLPDAVNVIKDYITAIRNNKPESFITEEKPCSALLVKKEKLAENGEYNLTGDRYRTVETRKHQKWPMVELGEVIDYEQPTEYIVNSENYSNEYLTPVLTAGKSFLLGYTDESNGIFPKEKLPVIIFDDFTTATKYVDFPFKVKSSAMKILKANEKINIKYAFYSIQKILFNASQHKRYWISEYSKIKIPLPPLEVQREIVAEIESYQKLIDGCRQVVDSWKPQIDIDPEWPVGPIADVAKVQGGYAFKSEDMIESSGTQIIKIGNVKDQRFAIDVNPSFVKDAFYNDYLDYQIKQNDILISMTGTAGKRDYGNVCMVDIEGKYLLNQRVGRIIPNDKIIPQFLFIVLNQEKTKDNFYANVTGGVRQGNISNKQIEAIQIPIPEKEIQKEIVVKVETERKIIDGCRELIKTYEGKIIRVIDKVWED